jgi:hypothetical protein
MATERLQQLPGLGIPEPSGDAEEGSSVAPEEASAEPSVL